MTRGFAPLTSISLMRVKSEDAFREADRASRLLGDMKHGVYEVKVHGGIGEEEKLIALLKFVEAVFQIAEKLRGKILVALKEVRSGGDEGQREVDQRNTEPRDTQQFMA